MDEIKDSYDGKFKGNTLIVGKTGCGKNYICPKLG